MPSLGYQGDYTDPATGLVDMGARWYNPATGGFTSADALALAPQGASSAASAAVDTALGDPLAGGGPGPYGYAANNPLTATDLTGHWGTAPTPGQLMEMAAKAAVAEEVVTGGPEDPVGDIAAGATLLAGGLAAGAAALGNWLTSSGGYSPSAGMNFSGLPNLSGLPDLSGLPNLSGLSGIDFSGLGNLNLNFNLLPQGSPLPGGGNCGISCLVRILLPPPCDQACHQALHVLHNENVIVPKPHEDPAITGPAGRDT